MSVLPSIVPWPVALFLTYLVPLIHVCVENWSNRCTTEDTYGDGDIPDVASMMFEPRSELDWFELEPNHQITFLSSSLQRSGHTISSKLFDALRLLPYIGGDNNVHTITLVTAHPVDNYRACALSFHGWFIEINFGRS